MSQEIKVIAEPRTCSGSTAARRLRRSGTIPAVLSTLGGESALIQLNAHDFERVMSQHANAQLMVSISLEGKSCVALLREIQRNGLSGRITHADFGQIDTTRKMRIQIQIVLVGEPVGVRTQNGVLEQHLRHIDVSCLPADVVESFTVDTTALKVGDDITVGDLAVGDKYTIATRADSVIATVAEVKEEVVVAAATDVAAAAAQPEISVKKGKTAEEDATAGAAAGGKAAPAAKAKTK
jgi:large subunit ribosomal protein L25